MCSRMVLHDMTVDKAVLEDHMSTIETHDEFPDMTHDKSVLVVLSSDYVVHISIAGYKGAAAEMKKLDCENGGVHSWKLFEYVKDAVKFRKRLLLLDKSIPLSPCENICKGDQSACPGQTPIDDRENCEKIGNMMHMEDVAVETAAVETAFNANMQEQIDMAPNDKMPAVNMNNQVHGFLFHL